ncbi:MAG: hypothetical protein ACRD6X_03630 [Pyrinomonadaceae bacterium]
MLIKNLGSQVESVWEGLRPTTKRLLAGALKTGDPIPHKTHSSNYHYDAHADWELSRLLQVLDERTRSRIDATDTSEKANAAELAEMCARILEEQSGSAEVFILLASRSIAQSNYDHLEKLADILLERFSPGEIAEIVRQTELPQIRAIAFETLAMLPVELVEPLLDDPLYAEVAINSLEQKAFEFDSEEARDVLERYDNSEPLTGN